MKAITLLLLSFFLITGTSYSQDCSSYQTGEFISTGESGETQIKRSKKYQIEKQGKIKAKFKVTWLNDCTYRLELVKTNSEWLEKNTFIIDCKIIETGANYYIVKCTSPETDILINVRIKRA